MKPMISLAAATGLVEAIKVAGTDPDELLRAFGLDRSTVSDPHRYMPASDFARLLEEAALATGDDCFGLHFGEHFNPKDFGPLTYVVLNAPTMLASIKDVARYLRVYNEAAEVTFSVEGRWAYLRHRLVNLDIENPRQQNEFALAVGLSTIRLMAGTRWSPTEVQFAHPAPRVTSEHPRVFGAPVSFGCETNAFVIERELIERQVPAADERLYPILRQYLDRALAEVPRDDALILSVRKAIGESMCHGDPTLAAVAGKAAMSPRTLQRRLAADGVDFKALVADTRRRFAVHYLRQPSPTLTEIAYLLGYSEVSAFNRAFKRWTGATPSEYRRGASRSAANRRAGGGAHPRPRAGTLSRRRRRRS
ncbi:MAG TPA: AraC family transcriptional regulator [Candidatus Methylomirabilis sp.]|nr:AraC family transcriptional regulator [Candidatus Methylomirabilis sp.]